MVRGVESQEEYEEEEMSTVGVSGVELLGRGITVNLSVLSRLRGRGSCRVVFVLKDMKSVDGRERVGRC